MDELERLIHASIVKFWSRRFAVLTTPANWFEPLKLKPPLTSAETRLKLPLFTLLALAMSEAAPSAGHQLTRPDGAGSHGGLAETVRAATELVTAPATLVTRTE